MEIFNFSDNRERNKYNQLGDEKKKKIIDGSHKEALAFNQLLNEGKISKEYLTLVQHDQSPEDVENIAQKIMEKVRMINEAGTIEHQSRKVSKEKFYNIIEQGLKCKKELISEKRFEQGFAKLSQFPLHISGTINIYDGTDTAYADQFRKWHKDEAKKLKEDLYIDFIIDPVSIRKNVADYGLSAMPAILDEHAGRNGKVRKILSEYVKKIGWQDVYDRFIVRIRRKGKYLEQDFPEDVFDFMIKKGKDLLEYYRFDYKDPSGLGVPLPCEVLIASYVGKKNSEKNRMPFDGIRVYDDYASSTIITWLNELSSKDLSNAIPVYNKYGDLIWPARITSKHLQEYIESKNNSK